MTAGARQGRYRDEFLSSNQLADQDPSLSKIAAYISQRETIERVKHRPNLTERAPNVEIDDIFLAAAEKKSAAKNISSISTLGVFLFATRRAVVAPLQTLQTS